MATTAPDLATTDAYGRTPAVLADAGAVAGRADDVLVVLLLDRPTGRYESDGGLLTWREPAPDAAIRVDVAMADIVDGRWAPGSTVYIAVQRNGQLRDMGTPAGGLT
jgi:hypothetical protein